MLAVLIVIYEGLGVGLLGAVTLRLVWPHNTVLSTMGPLAITMVTMATGAIVISAMGGAPGIVVTLLVICLGLIALGVGLLLGGWILGVGTGEAVASSASQRMYRDDLADVVQQLADVSDRFDQLSSNLSATRTTIAGSRQEERPGDTARRQLITWFSRTLRAPVVWLAETVESAVDDPVPRLRADVQRLAHTADNLHHLSQIQAGSLGMTPVSVALNDLVSETVAELDALVGEEGGGLRIGRLEPVVVVADRREMARAITELLTNAIRCDGPGSAVSVEMRTAAAQAMVSISDGCGGIPEQDLGSLFKVGWRGTDYEDRGGLGLTLVQGIVQAHHGAVDVRNIPGGCCFEIRLPVTGGE